MTHPFDEHGDRLRRALHAEADAVMPSPEGLERIRTRIVDVRERRGLRGWAARASGLPWLRPMAAAAAAAMAVATIALAAPPVISTIAGDTIGGKERGAGRIPPTQTGGFSSQANSPDAQLSPEATTPTPGVTPSPSAGASGDPTCRPGSAPSTAPSGSPTPAPRPSQTCDRPSQPPVSPGPGPSGGTDPTPPTTDTSPAPAGGADGRATTP